MIYTKKIGMRHWFSLVLLYNFITTITSAMILSITPYNALTTKIQFLVIVLIPEHTLVNPVYDIELKLITSSSESHQYT